MSLSWRSTLGWRPAPNSSTPAVWGAKPEPPAITPPRDAPWLLRLMDYAAHPVFRLDGDAHVTQANAHALALALNHEGPLPDALAHASFGEAAPHAALWRLLALPVEGSAELLWRHRSGREYLLEAHRLPKALDGWLVSAQPRDCEPDLSQVTLNLMNHDLRAPSAHILTLLDLQDSEQHALPMPELLREISHHAHQSLHATQWLVQIAKTLQQAETVAPLALAPLLEDCLDAHDETLSWFCTMQSAGETKAAQALVAAQRCRIELHGGDFWVLGSKTGLEAALIQVLAAARCVVGAGFRLALQVPPIELHAEPQQLGRVALRVQLPAPLQWPAGWRFETDNRSPGMADDRLWAWATRRLLMAGGLRVEPAHDGALCILLPQTLARLG